MTCAVKSLALAVLGWATLAVAAPGTYRVDPNHTHPLFEVDHFGLSQWRGLFKTTSGTITLDRERGTGTVEVVVDVASVELGHTEMARLEARLEALQQRGDRQIERDAGHRHFL